MDPLKNRASAAPTTIRHRAHVFVSLPSLPSCPCPSLPLPLVCSTCLSLPLLRCVAVECCCLAPLNALSVLTDSLSHSHSAPWYQSAFHFPRCHFHYLLPPSGYLYPDGRTPLELEPPPPTLRPKTNLHSNDRPPNYLTNTPTSACTPISGGAYHCYTTTTTSRYKGH